MKNLNHRQVNAKSNAISAIAPFAFVAVFTLIGVLSEARPGPRYSYDCEPGAEGVEDLCIALPTGSETERKRETKKPTSSTAATGATIGAGSSTGSGTKSGSQREGAKSIAREPIFGTVDANFSAGNSTRPGVSPRAQSAASAMTAMRTQERIRQVETFLRGTQSPSSGTGAAGDGDPTAAGSQ